MFEEAMGDDSGATVIDFRVRLPSRLRPTGIPPPEYVDQYDAVLDTRSKSAAALDDLVREMSDAGVGQAIVHAEYEYGNVADALNDAVAELVASGSSMFFGFSTIGLAPLRIRTMVRQVDTGHSSGMRGINIQPSFFGIQPADRRLYPVYSRAEELGMVVALHSGVNYTTHQIIESDHPRYFDRVACDFPNLKIVACHAGWPWATELVAVMRKHPNVYADFGGLSPRYVGEADTGWGVMRRFMDSLLCRQVLFATDWPVFAHRRALQEWRAMGLKDETLSKLFRTNVQQLLGVGAS